MNAEKIGKFICELRKEKNLSQQSLADMIPISREAISKWERGKNLPDSSSLMRLSEIFDVTINEIFYGERKSENNIKDVENITVNVFNERNRSVKLLKFISALLIIVLLAFLGYYFFATYNTIEVYTIDYTDENVDINDGIFVVTKDKIYFDLGRIETKEEIKSLRLYEKNNNQDNLIVYTEDDWITVYDFYGYNAYFDYEKINETINNLYLDINFENDTKTIQLKLIRDFANNKIFYEKLDNITSPSNNSGIKQNNCTIYDDEVLKKVFEHEKDDVYKYINEEENIELTYFADAYTLILDKYENDTIKYWNYTITTDYLVYQEIKNKKTIYSFNYGKCTLSQEKKFKKDDIELINYFYKTIDNIYENQ